MKVYVVTEEWIWASEEGQVHNGHTERGIFYTLEGAGEHVVEIASKQGVALVDTTPREVVFPYYVMDVSWGHMFHIREVTVQGTPPAGDDASRWCPHNLILPESHVDEDHPGRYPDVGDGRDSGG